MRWREITTKTQRHGADKTKVQAKRHRYVVSRYARDDKLFVFILTPDF